ncbi:pseudouridine synthase [Histoplasma capsulatum var. duboisii H88]|uniref:Pseudouridine synthase n=1 Tax=Ajellomyces capsulatus (strain H88) TaxID=544711 RepID=A0A8A1LN80_AJEC8|nr:pseudouridine synthase [Histoplasma capsulatum var. duboisii H88]
MKVAPTIMSGRRRRQAIWRNLLRRRCCLKAHHHLDLRLRIGLPPLLLQPKKSSRMPPHSQRRGRMALKESYLHLQHQRKKGNSLHQQNAQSPQSIAPRTILSPMTPPSPLTPLYPMLFLPPLSHPLHPRLLSSP